VLFTKLNRSKRAVGSIIGAVFILLIIMSGFVFYELVQKNMNDYVSVADSMDKINWHRNNEEISILNVEIMLSGNLNITCKNTGNVESTVIWLGLFNQSTTPEGQWFFLISHQINPSQTVSFTSSFMVTTGQQYIVQLVTKEGNTYDYQLNAETEIPLALNLIAGSPTVYVGNNLTLFLTVTNNNTFTVQNLTVNIAALPSNLTTVLLAPTTLTISTLTPGSSIFFRWIYGATQQGTVTFEATYNKMPPNTLAQANILILEQPTSSDNQGKVTITGTYATTKFPSTQWNLLGGTSYVNGTIPSLSDIDGNMVTFSSYASGGTNTIAHYVNSSSSQVDGTENIGSLSNFFGMQTDPDGNFATLTEGPISNPSSSFGNPSSSGSSYTQISGSGSLGDSFTSGNLSSSVSSISFFGRSATGTISAKALICDSTGLILTNGISNPASITTTAAWWTFTFASPPTINPNTTYWLMIIANGNVRLYYSSLTGGTSKSDSSNNYVSPTAPTDATSGIIQYRIYANTSSANTYRLDFETQWTGVNTNMQRSDLAIYMTSKSGSENMAVDVWNSGAWQNLFSSLSVGWNNASVSSYINSSTFTIRFRDGSPFDLTQDSWSIDSALIQQTSTIDQYTANVEFIGISNTKAWKSLIWNLESSLDASGVNVTIQLYNYTLGSYMESGNVCASFSSIANISNQQSGTLTENSNNLRSVDGTWKVKITAVKDTSVPFNVYVDLVEINPTFQSSGDTLPYGTNQTYIVTAISGTGGPIPYSYFSIYVNGTSITTQNAENQAIANPAWVQLDKDGTYQLKLCATNSGAQTFTIYASVGTTVGQKDVLQEAT
jgi:hypothetical protein